jgi:uncharacterized RDD family membrane protein YckC
VSTPGHPSIDTIVSIETPEHIVFQHRVAGPARRAMAHLIDLVLCYGAVLVVGIVIFMTVLGAASVGAAFDDALKTGVGAILVVLFIAQWIWFLLWEGLRGDTPGKRAHGLRVVTTNGRPIGFSHAALRNVLRAADLLPTAYLVGVVTMSISRRFQRVGDLVAGTVVVSAETRARREVRTVLWPPPYPHELAALPPDVVLDAEERAALELFLRRMGTLGAAREQELAAMIVERVARRHGWQGPILDPARTLALLFDRAANTGRAEAPPSSRGRGLAA